MAEPFAFLEPGVLRDGELDLVLATRRPAEPEKGYVPAYGFVMMVGAETAGRVGFRAQSTTLLEQVGGHVGYEVEERFRGRHFAERACRLLFPLMRAHGFREIVLTCNPGNWASRRTCERLGAEMAGIVAVPEDHEMYLRGEHHKCRYVLALD